MDEATRAEVDAWLFKAQRDLDSARRLLAGDPPYRDTAAYHCQQSAEKAIKAFLTALATPFPKTHDLTALVRLATGIEPAAVQWQEAAIVLTPYATLFRYPDACIEPSAGDANEALSLAMALMQDIAHRVRS
jgi:HEPN domain-containing protein